MMAFLTGTALTSGRQTCLFSCPGLDVVFTLPTLTLKIASMASFISFLRASGSTANTYLFSSCFFFFSPMTGLDNVPLILYDSLSFATISKLSLFRDNFISVQDVIGVRQLSGRVTSPRENSRN